MPTRKASSNPPRDPNNASEDETAGAGPSGQGKTQRIAKACDRCRKSKSKCEPSPNEGEPCKACAALETGEFSTPSFRRGPPKGYIQAMEHRLHQVESVLAAIMSSTDPRAQSIVDELSQDDLAAHILDTVDAGPFGKTGREQRSIDTSKDNFFRSIVTEQPKALSHRSRRQSRATRENVIEAVIASDPQIQTTRPTLAWQDRLSTRLARGSSASESFSPVPASPTPDSSVYRHTPEPPRNKRRLDGQPSVQTPSFVPPSQSAADTEDLADCADAFGNLSIDENREVRYHGNSSGLQLLALTERSDGRNAKGIWRFPMAKVWPGVWWSNDRTTTPHAQTVEASIHLPPPQVQDHLVEVFFAHVNPCIPVLDEESFMAQYKAHYPDAEDDLRPSGSDAEVRPERPQRLSKLLLLSIFAYAASHFDPQDTRAGTVSDPAAEYTKQARMILDTIYQESRSSTVQALVLLGMREFGAGSLEEGWLHIGMAIRMALDLGLNRNSDKWMHNGRELFTEKQKSVRKRIWWACCLADKFSALFLGRPIAIHESDFSTPLLDIPQDDLKRTWQPCSLDPLYGRLSPIPAMYTSYFRYISSLYIITGEVLAKIYRVSRENILPSRAVREQLHQRLSQWSLELPDHLNYSTKSSRPCPPPHVLALHIQYWATMLLLHRPFIPNGSDLAKAGSPSLNPDPIAWESFDLCQSAASQIGSFGMLYQEKYDMRWGPPFLSNCLQAAGVLCIVTLRFKPMDTQASVALQKCIAALKGLERTWTVAYRVRELLQNAKVHIDQTFSTGNTTSSASPDAQDQSLTQVSQNSVRQKRPAQIAFGEVSWPPPPPPPPPPPRAWTFVSTPGSVPLVSSYQVGTGGVHPSAQTAHAIQMGVRDNHTYATGYIPGYDSWWPVLDSQAEITTPAAPVGQVEQHPGGVAGSGVMPQTGAAGLPSQEFTFTTQHFTPEFLQAMRDPMLHFPSVFAHQGF
ncbi:fungal-specific transcription factor domain-containing protein [Dichomitus squalens]|nr:fungal-specific transcription factor domain-containing protein [Dichomitus squalens]